MINVLRSAVTAAHGILASRPTGFHAQWQEGASQALQDTGPVPPVLTQTDLDELPMPLADYIRRSGAVGQPQVTSLHADFHGRIRLAPDAAWMSFTGKQVNTFGPRPQRMFIMDATRSGLPVTVLHSYADAKATMRAKVLSLITVVDASGPELDRGETVTVFNDLVVLAPGAIAGVPVRWASVGLRRVRGDFTNGGQTVSAVLTFDDDGDLIDFVSDDRPRASADGTTFTQQRWSTPLGGYREEHGQRMLASGAARWYDTGTEAWFTYVELHLDDIAYNVSQANGQADDHPSAPRCAQPS